MWLTDYLQKRWGLLCLVGGATVIGLWLFGGGKPAEKRRPPRPGPAGAALQAKPAFQKKLTVASVTRYCVQRGVAAARPAQPQPQMVRHPGFPAPRKSPPTLGGPKVRGLFPLRSKLRGLGARRLVHAPLIHRLARGFTERYHYFKYLSENRRAARRYYHQQMERRRRKGLTPTGLVGPMGKHPPSSIIAQKARSIRRSSLGYYRELIARTMAGYAARPRALLEYASLLMSRIKRIKRAPSGGPFGRHTELLRVLHLLLEDHPTSPEAIEAMALLAHQTSSGGKCAKVVFMLKDLSTAPLSQWTSARMALVRGLAHYHAGRCLLKRGFHDAAAKRLSGAVADARQARAAGAPLGGPLAREAAILWARAYGAAGNVSGARAQLARLGPNLVNLATGVLVAQLLKEGQLRACMHLCTSGNRSRGRRQSPPGAK
jgi:hypothetical protein